MQLVQLAVIDSTVPAISSDPVVPPPTRDHFRLSLDISPTGFTLRGAEDTLAEDEATIPCPEGACQNRDSYDFTRLTELLTEIKGAHPAEDVIIFVPHERIPYEVLVAAMDAARGAEEAGGLLFPRVTIAGGLSG
jgi:hypothetical protein